MHVSKSNLYILKHLYLEYRAHANNLMCLKYDRCVKLMLLMVISISTCQQKKEIEVQIGCTRFSKFFMIFGIL
jgi:hypothetical protein